MLIVEDEAVIAKDLCSTIEDWGGAPIGPAASVREALDLLAKTPDCEAAIVDVSLPDRDIGPVLDRLEERGAAVIVCTGYAVPPTFGRDTPRRRYSKSLFCRPERSKASQP